MSNRSLANFTIQVASRHPRTAGSAAYDRETHEYLPQYVMASRGWFIGCDARGSLRPAAAVFSRPRVSDDTILDPREISPEPPVVVPDNVVSYRWSIQQLSGGIQSESVLNTRDEPRYRDNPILMTQQVFNVFSQGTYSFRLEVTFDDGTVQSNQQRFTLRDRLVVSIGDSYASGEGVPDTIGRTGTIPLGELLERIPGVGSLASGDEFCSQATFVQAVEWSRSPNTGIGVEWSEPFAHRSWRSGPSLAAQALESLDRGDVVTFLSFARSGSKIVEGLLSPRRQDYNWKPIGQLEEIRQTVLDRQIDALVISISGNDAGFATGLRELVEGDGFIWLFSDDSINRSEVERDAVERIGSLPGLFEQLARAIEDIDQLSPDRVYITEYPEALFDDPRTDTGLNGACGIFSGWNLDIDIADARLIKTLAQQLNEQIRAAAQLHGWNYVDGIVEGFAGHGYCSGQSFFVFAEDSCRQQGDFEGTMHPNVAGQQILADRIAAALRPRLFPATPQVVVPDFSPPIIGPVSRETETGQTVPPSPSPTIGPIDVVVDA